MTLQTCSQKMSACVDGGKSGPAKHEQMGSLVQARYCFGPSLSFPIKFNVAHFNYFPISLLEQQFITGLNFILKFVIGRVMLFVFLFSLGEFK